MITDRSANLMLNATRQIRQFAESGIPVIPDGGAPGIYPSADGRDEPNIRNAVHDLKRTENIHIVAQGHTSTTLATIGVIPRVHIHTNGTWYTSWKEGSASQSDYVSVFSAGNAATGKLEIAPNKIPYIFDLWTRTIRPCFEYRRGLNDTTIIPLQLAANQTVVIGLSEKAISNVTTPSIHVLQAPRTVMGYEVNRNGSLVIHVAARDANEPLRLSSGADKTKLLESVAPSSRAQLSSWIPVAEHWEVPDNVYNVSVIARKHNTTHHLDRLVSWQSIPGLANASGVGYSTTHFTWPPANSPSDSNHGAYLFFPMVTQSLRVAVNGEYLPPLD